MEFRIADTFTDSLARLTREEQKAVKTTAFDLQINPAHPSMQFHRIDKAKDKHFWSVRVSSDIRLIVHKNEQSLLLCYVDHHDKAYEWAERRKLEVHPTTGAAQLVEIREKVQEILVPVYVEEKKISEQESRKLFEHIKRDQLLSYGVPAEWIDDVKQATEESLYLLIDYLPAEAAEALLQLAYGEAVVAPQPVEKNKDPFTHPDAQRRFRTMHNVEELERALEYPWDKWAVFLHPSQRQWVERDYSGPARVSGSAGTGKTIVALHRAVHLARKHSEARVLLATFSPMLSNALRRQLIKLISNEPRLAERIDVYAMRELGATLYKSRKGKPVFVTRQEIIGAVNNFSKELPENRFSLSFLVSEWEQVVDTWQLSTWESYRDVKRLGRKTRLPEPQRAMLWSLFEKLNHWLVEKKLLTDASLFQQLYNDASIRKNFPYQFAVIDEAQDISVTQLRFFSLLLENNPNALFFAGDQGQRIFQQAFSWKATGIDVRGRSKVLQVNYRTSHQIRQQADRLLAPEITDADGNAEERTKTISVFNGLQPDIRVVASEKEETTEVAAWISQQVNNGTAPHEIGIFVRSDAQVNRALHAIKETDVSYTLLDESMETKTGTLAVSTMHLAKGLEFRCVAVMACDDEVIPLQERIASVTEDSDLQEVYNTERHLLYVACTRARDVLLVIGVDPASEFLQDLSIS